MLSLLFLVSAHAFSCTIDKVPTDVVKLIVEHAVMPTRSRYSDLRTSLKTYRSLCLVNKKFNTLLPKLTINSQWPTAKSGANIKDQLLSFYKSSKKKISYYNYDDYIDREFLYIYWLLCSHKKNPVEILKQTEHFLENEFGNVERRVMRGTETKISMLGTALSLCDSTMVALLLQYGANQDCVAWADGKPINAIQFITRKIEHCDIDYQRENLKQNLALFAPEHPLLKNQSTPTTHPNSVVTANPTPLTCHWCHII